MSPLSPYSIWDPPKCENLTRCRTALPEYICSVQHLLKGAHNRTMGMYQLSHQQSKNRDWGFAGRHCWRSKKNLGVMWTPNHGTTVAGRAQNMYIQQLVDVGCQVEDLNTLMEDWRERVTQASLTGCGLNLKKKNYFGVSHYYKLIFRVVLKSSFVVLKGNKRFYCNFDFWKGFFFIIVFCCFIFMSVDDLYYCF